MDRSSSLSQHKFIKGKFITPFNNSLMMELGKENSWFHGRLPEYIWLALILRYYGRVEGLLKCRSVLQILRKAVPNFYSPKLSRILALECITQQRIYTDFNKYVDVASLSALTVIFTHSQYPTFATAFLTSLSPEERIEKINDVIAETSDHQSELATDIRFLVLYFHLLSGKFHMQKETLELLLEYPTLSHKDEKMRMIRPMVRAMEIATPDEIDPINEQYLFTFWDGVSRISDCNLFYIDMGSDSPDTKEYMKYAKAQLQYYTELFQAACPLDNKMLVLLGIATYSYKRICEVVEHNLFNTIAGRSVVRVLIENYIMMKYLIKHESEHEDIWIEYQYYGIGQYKLISERYRESKKDMPNSHVMYDYMDALVGEYKNKEFIDMDTSYFDKMNVREKAINVGEKELFGLYYDYDSAFEHGLWGAIRESSLIKCNTPSHQYHCVPDIENNQKLKSIWFDCMEAMNNILKVLNNVYGLPEHLLNKDIDNG